VGESSRKQASRPPEVGELKAFCLAADLGSLGRAAIALRVSQPAVSKRLRSLESLAGAELLARSPRGVSLTAAGRALYPDAQRLLAQAAALQATLAQLGRDEPAILAAVSHTVAEHYLPARLVAYDASEAAPHAPVELVAANSTTVRAMVCEERADLGIAAVDDLVTDPDGLTERVLTEDEIVLAVPQAHLWYQRETIPRTQFLATPLIVRDPEAHSRRFVERTLALAGDRLARPLREVGSTAAAKREALDRCAPALLSAASIDETRDRLYVRRVEGLRFLRRFALLYRSEHTLTASQRGLVEFLLEA
jgi:DNA-binding transcriptional LysR family regulator